MDNKLLMSKKIMTFIGLFCLIAWLASWFIAIWTWSLQWFLTGCLILFITVGIVRTLDEKK
jgi:fatty acid desaturase